MKYAATFFVFVITIAYSNNSGFSFYSEPLLFKPLVANTFEPRVGLLWHINDNRLRLDIGNSIDILQYQFENDSRLLTFGADFFTYTLLKGESNFHFPVDAVDYFFGFNVNYKDTLATGIFSWRLRLSHISAHFVDGHYDNTTKVWKDGLNPRVYSREFLEFVAAYQPMEMLRCYLGLLYVWHIDPPTLPTTLLYLGAELHKEFYTALNGYLAYQFTVTGMRPRHELQIGGKIGNWRGRGTQIFFAYHYGNSIHGEYYDQKDEYSGIGFNVDF